MAGPMGWRTGREDPGRSLEMICNASKRGQTRLGQ